MNTLPNGSSARPTASAKRPSRWALYHGTSTLRLETILKENRLRAMGSAPIVSLTTDQYVAEYFACNAVFGDKHFPPREDSDGVVLVLDGEKLMKEGHPLVARVNYRDSLKAAVKKWDPENWDLENEILLETDIPALKRFLIDTIAVDRSTYEIYREQGRPAFMPRVAFAANVEHVVMETLLHTWAGDVSRQELDTIAFAVKGIRDALALLRQSKRPSAEDSEHDA